MNFYTWEDSNGDWHIIIAKDMDQAGLMLYLMGYQYETLMEDEPPVDNLMEYLDGLCREGDVDDTSTWVAYALYKHFETMKGE